MGIFLGCLTSTNYNMVAGCCCDLFCDLSTDDPGTTIIDGIDISNKDFTGTIVDIDGNPISFPYFISVGAPISIHLQICAPEFLTSDTFEITVISNGGQSTFFQTILSSLTSGFFNPSDINFGTIAPNQTTGSGIDINQVLPPLLCCVNFRILGIDAPFSTNFTGAELCDIQSTQFQVFFEPTSVGTFAGSIRISVGCNIVEIPLLGRAIEISPNGNNVSGTKRTVVDCPSGDCKLFNPQPGFDQKTKNSINQISRFTAPKGGPGRGTNFRK